MKTMLLTKVPENTGVIYLNTAKTEAYSLNHVIGLINRQYTLIICFQKKMIFIH